MAQPKKQKTKNLVLLLNETSSRVWRIFPNTEELIRRGWNVHKVEHGQKVTEKEFQWGDVFLQELGLNYMLPNEVKKRGKVFIYDIDDLVTSPPKNHPDYESLSRPIVRYRTWRTIHNSHVLITSNQFLYDHYKWARPKEAHVFGNYVSYPYWGVPPQSNQSDSIRLGWTGSPAHYEDLKFIEPVIARLLKEFPKLKFVYCGMGSQRSAKRPDFEYQIGKDVFDIIPDERREYVMGVPWENFPDRLASLQLDIGIAPVMCNKFGIAKTPIKWMEYAVNKVPAVASECLYGPPNIRSGIDGIAVPNTEEAWYSAIRSLVVSETRRRAMGEAASERIKRDFNMKDHVGRWADIIDRSLGRYHKDYRTE